MNVRCFKIIKKYKEKFEMQLGLRHEHRFEKKKIYFEKNEQNVYLNNNNRNTYLQIFIINFFLF